MPLNTANVRITIATFAAVDMPLGLSSFDCVDCVELNVEFVKRSVSVVKDSIVKVKFFPSIVENFLFVVIYIVFVVEIFLVFILFVVGFVENVVKFLIMNLVVSTVL